MRDILIYAEQQDGKMTPVTYEILGKARKLADEKGKMVTAILLGHKISHLARELIRYGADRVYTVDAFHLRDFDDVVYSNVIINLIKQEEPEIVLAGATPTGRSIMPYIAASLETGLTADCIDLTIDKKTGLLLQNRAAFGENVMVTITCPQKRPQMATIRPYILSRPKPDPKREGEIINIALDEGIKSCIQVVKFVKEIEDNNDLMKADIIVSGGRGLKDAKNFKLISDLAKLLDAKVGATRPVVEAGWAPASCQIGQSGKIVNPKLYIACGISGAIQHTVGIKAKIVVAINNDPNAPIFDIADYGIVGDLFEVIPTMIKEIERRRSIET